jgi:peptidoglycan hydrolase CwlO-like protein
MSADLIVEIILGVLSACIAAGAFIAATRASRVQAELLSDSEKAAKAKVDAQAFDRAKTIYESAIATLQEQTRVLQSQVRTLQSEVSKLQNQSTELRAQIRTLQKTNSALGAELHMLQETNEELRAEVDRLQNGQSA